MPAKKPELGCRDQDLHPNRMPTEPSESESELTGERSADLEFRKLQYASEADVSFDPRSPGRSSRGPVQSEEPGVEPEEIMPVMWDHTHRDRAVSAYLCPEQTINNEFTQQFLGPTISQWYFTLMRP